MSFYLDPDSPTSPQREVEPPLFLVPSPPSGPHHQTTNFRPHHESAEDLPGITRVSSSTTTTTTGVNATAPSTQGTTSLPRISPQRTSNHGGNTMLLGGAPGGERRATAAWFELDPKGGGTDDSEPNMDPKGGESNLDSMDPYMDMSDLFDLDVSPSLVVMRGLGRDGPTPEHDLGLSPSADWLQPPRSDEVPLVYFFSSRDFAKYRKLRTLGKGSGGTVWAVERTFDKHQYAARIVDLRHLHSDQRQYALNEPKLMSQCDSCFVLSYEDTWTDEKTAVVTVMELVEGTNLRSHLRGLKESATFHMHQIRRIARGLPEQPMGAAPSARTEREQKMLPLTPQQLSLLEEEHSSVREHLHSFRLASLSEKDVLMMFVQILAGVYHLHSRGIVHRDLKPASIFLSDTGILKVGDLGLALATDGSSTPTSVPWQLQGEHTDPHVAAAAVGTSVYMAPELWDTVVMPPYSTKSDIWALGVMLYEMLAGRRPFEGKNFSAAIRAGEYPSIRRHNPAVSISVVDLIASMLSMNPSQRPSAIQVIAHPKLTEALEMLLRDLKKDKSIDRSLRVSLMKELKVVYLDSVAHRRHRAPLAMSGYQAMVADVPTTSRDRSVSPQRSPPLSASMQLSGSMQLTNSMQLGASSMRLAATSLRSVSPSAMMSASLQLSPSLPSLSPVSSVRAPLPSLHNHRGAVSVV